MNNELITVEEARRILKVGRNTMIKLLNRREFSLKIGGKWFCNRKLLENWIDDQVLCKNVDNILKN